MLLAACGGEETLGPSPPALPEAPSNFGIDIPSPVRNPMTLAGVALGRRLFYDPLLSGDDGVACATCHQQALAFGDGVALGDAGVSGRSLLRHAPALQNLAWAEGLFWDGGAVDLESLAFAPLQHPDEQAQDVIALVGEIEAVEGYPAMFQAAFDPGEVSLPNLVRALAQFQRTLISAGSRYDRHVRGEPDGDLSAEELAGMDAVRRHCAGCHASDHSTDFGYHNNGLDASYSDRRALLDRPPPRSALTTRSGTTPSCGPRRTRPRSRWPGRTRWRRRRWGT